MTVQSGKLCVETTDGRGSGFVCQQIFRNFTKHSVDTRHRTRWWYDRELKPPVIIHLDCCGTYKETDLTSTKDRHILRTPITL